MATRTSAAAGDLYTVGEMAAMQGVSRQTLIYYDRIGLFCPATTSKAGYRLYLPEQVPTLRLIVLLKELGLSLEEVGEVVRGHSPQALLERLPRQLDQIDGRIERLREQREFVRQRIEFYEEAVAWQETLGELVLRECDERWLVFEPFGEARPGRPELHATLARAMRRLHDGCGATPARGFGSMLRQDALGGADPLAGAGTFVVVPDGVDAQGLAGAVRAPAGTYACRSRFGMPYDASGARELLDEVAARGLAARGDVLDFCLLDATSYDDEHQEDLCCLQVLVG